MCFHRGKDKEKRKREIGWFLPGFGLWVLLLPSPAVKGDIWWCATLVVVIFVFRRYSSEKTKKKRRMGRSPVVGWRRGKERGGRRGDCAAFRRVLGCSTPVIFRWELASGFAGKRRRGAGFVVPANSGRNNWRKRRGLACNYGGGTGGTWSELMAKGERRRGRWSGEGVSFSGSFLAASEMEKRGRCRRKRRGLSPALVSGECVAGKNGEKGDRKRER
ncbi:hypothetical protein HAX54_022874 [Datura stramonium]|uniref:Uncharacterized protein n=1 Tax=Datura stramonium TaxID=4076 RepID=A0ABS8UV84_DATST|nr:hypothetical protein [Datura stramonium]